ncbi:MULTISPECIES: ATP-dependent metallopeptidase FtsH/Yme1/Tma family protein [Wolbachia]|nr:MULTISPECIES: ATP-dependent metallopeptidase FtsH/Yme1/Tma family protein [Wolbachia]MDE5061109.1 ATP-dependent metallopeptidase FtsH/Yme1/Tma family protein [Wolbachia endosymbiont of Drosophila nikananu]
MTRWKFLKIALLCLAIVATIFAIYMLFFQGEGLTTISFSEFSDRLESNDIKSVVIDGNSIVGKFKDESSFKLVSIISNDLIKILRDKRVHILFSTEAINADVILNSISIIIFLGVLVFGWVIYEKNFTISLDDKLITEEEKLKFSDVAISDEVKESLEMICHFIKNRKNFEQSNCDIPTGYILYGPPGNGKTLLFRAIAGEVNIPCYSVSASEFSKPLMGAGPAYIRDLFEKLRKNSSCILFIDEIDAVSRRNNSETSAINNEERRMITQLLSELDGIKSRKDVIVIGATNHLSHIDKALLRPGRLGEYIHIPLPEEKEREKILNINLKNIQRAPDVNLEEIAHRISNCSGADLSDLAKKVKYNAMNRSHKGTIPTITMDDFNRELEKMKRINEARVEQTVNQHGIRNSSQQFI